MRIFVSWLSVERDVSGRLCCVVPRHGVGGKVQLFVERSSSARIDSCLDKKGPPNHVTPMLNYHFPIPKALSCFLR